MRRISPEASHTLPSGEVTEGPRSSPCASREYIASSSRLLRMLLHHSYQNDHTFHPSSRASQSHSQSLPNLSHTTLSLLRHPPGATNELNLDSSRTPPTPHQLVAWISLPLCRAARGREKRRGVCRKRLISEMRDCDVRSGLILCTRAKQHFTLLF